MDSLQHEVTRVLTQITFADGAAIMQDATYDPHTGKRCSLQLYRVSPGEIELAQARGGLVDASKTPILTAVDPDATMIYVVELSPSGRCKLTSYGSQPQDLTPVRGRAHLYRDLQTAVEYLGSLAADLTHRAD